MVIVEYRIDIELLKTTELEHILYVCMLYLNHRNHLPNPLVTF